LYNRPKYQQNNQGNNTKTEQKCVTFTYTGNYTHKVTNLFKDANLNVAFKTTTTVGKLLTNRGRTNTYVRWAQNHILVQNDLPELSESILYRANGPNLNNKIQRSHKKHKV
jgi:hypothetical protein